MMFKTLAALATTLTAAFVLGVSGLPGWLLDLAVAQWGHPPLPLPL